uniref:Uncharacterized protein n=1 Tax=Acrobeloides nanus TaxID=290746 RepID=A0A914EBQ0_9BILA
MLRLFIGLVSLSSAKACGGSGTNNQIYTNPTFQLSFNPPAAWTYPDSSAPMTLDYFPGQPLLQTQAQTNAIGALTAAMLQALSESEINTALLTVTATYTAPQVSDCVKVVSGTITGSNIGAVIGIEQAGAIVQLATIGTAMIPAASCASRTYTGVTFTYAPFIQMATIQVQGLTASGITLTNVANALMALLNLNNNAIFTQQVTFK